jgi:hypothetical protein
VEKVMRIYRFNTETGFYLGEDFADRAPLKGGAFEIAEDATTISPPEVKRGEVPVFHPDAGKWEVRKLDPEIVRMPYTLSRARLN